VSTAADLIDSVIADLEAKYLSLWRTSNKVESREFYWHHVHALAEVAKELKQRLQNPAA
jgi:hypothetical protein